MIPKRAKSFIKESAEEQNIPEILLEDLVDFYWAEVRSVLTTGTEPVVYIKNLCTFTVRPWVLERSIESKNAQIENIDPASFHNFAKLKNIEKNRDRLKVLHEKVQEIENLKSQHKKKRNAYNMEKSEADPGRDSE